MLRIPALVTLLLIQSCASFKIKHGNIVNEDELYSIVKREIESAHAEHLKECNCMKALYRDLSGPKNNTARYVFDHSVAEEAVKLSENKDTVSILAIGSGKLLNELTAFAQVLASGKNLNIFLTDWAYVFYGEPDFEKKAQDLGAHPEKIPQGWSDFYFWAWAQNKEKPYLPFFIEHHQSIDEFKLVIAKLDKIFHTKSTINIIKPPTDKPITLPELDMIISIDSFIDVPNLMGNLFYQLRLSKNPVRFVALNKTKSLGGFWESSDLKKREYTSMQNVTLDIYDLSSTGPEFGSYRQLQRRIFTPRAEQIKSAPEFKTDPNKDSTQNIFEEHQQSSH